MDLGAPRLARSTVNTTDPSAAALHAQLIGQPTINCNKSTVQLSNRKSRALLAYLLLTDKGREKRERLVGLLWSETDEARARASLRQALYETKSALAAAGYVGFEAARFDVGLQPNSFKVDITDVLEQVKAGVPHPLLLDTERLTDRLLDGCDAIDPAFDIWLTAKREAIRQRLERDLETALRESAAAGRRVEDIARAILNLDPTHEEAARALMTARHASGDTAGALTVYKRLWDLLDEEYDTEPSKDTLDLVASIKMGQAPAPRPVAPLLFADPLPPTATMPTKAGEPTTARWSSRFVLSVAPFEIAAARTEQLHLVHGFRRELLACLARFREWVVRDLGPAGGPQLAPLGPEAE